MPSFRLGHHRLLFRWGSVCFTLLGISVFVLLGIWQWHRAEEKTQMLRLHDKRTLRTPQKWDLGQTQPLQYERRRVNGHYQSMVFLLDNQYHQHQWGYHVLSPYQLDLHTVLMVDRGWVKGDPLRQQLPQIETPKGDRSLLGQVYYPSVNRWIKQLPLTGEQPSPVVIEQFSAALLEPFLHQRVLPFMLRLDKTATDGWVRDWQIVSMPPARHLAYALQWFCFAGVLGVIFIGLHLRRIDEHT